MKGLFAHFVGVYFHFLFSGTVSGEPGKWECDLLEDLHKEEGRNGCVGLVDTVCLKMNKGFCTDGATCQNNWNDWEDYGICLCLPNLQTTENKTCACMEGRMTETGHCFLNYGELCNSDENRYAKCLPGMVCREGECSCEFEDQQYYNGTNKCKSHLGGVCSKLHESCPENAECMTSADMRSNETNQCQCKTGSVEVDQRCEIAFNRQCKKDGGAACYSQAGLECIDGVCKCKSVEFYDFRGNKCRGRVGALCSKQKQDYCQDGAICEHDGVGYCVYKQQAQGNGSSISEEEFENLKSERVLPTNLHLPKYNESVVQHERPGNRLWSNAQVPYVVDNSFSAYQRKQIALAFKEFQENTCIRFIPKRSNHTSWLNIIHEPSVCAVAHRCMNTGPQFAKVGGDCVTAGVIIHQLGKTLCMGYEPSRADRDEWISFNTSICQPYEKDDRKSFSRRRLHKWYDYFSSQHPEDECISGCIRPKVNEVNICGSGGPLSLLDIESLNELYGCATGCLDYRYVSFDKLTHNSTAGYDYDGEILQSCRRYEDGHILPGSRYSHSARFACRTRLNEINYNYQGKYKEILEIPLGESFKWNRTDILPPNAFRGGVTRDRENLFVVRCKITWKDGRVGWRPGLYQPSAGAFINKRMPGNVEFLVCS